MAAHYICDHCGYRGFDPDEDASDQVLCPMCGEPVQPDIDADDTPFGSARALRPGGARGARRAARRARWSQ